MHGVVCGHIHAPVIRQFEHYLYLNTGDWVDSCSALVEKFDGTLELMRWTSLRARGFEPDHEREALQSAA